MIREVGLFLSLLLSLRISVLAQDSNCLDSKWLPENYIYNPGNECEPYDGSRIPNCLAFIHPGTKEPYYHLHEYDCSKFWECGPAGETCLFHCAPCGDLCPGYNGLSFDCRYQFPMGPVCDFPINVDCENHIPCPSCDDCPHDWQICDESTGCKCTPECQVDPDCPTDQYCDSEGVCQDGCRAAENCLATACSDCINHQCVDPNCCDDDDCPNGVCLNGECVECVVDGDCGGCATCVANQCLAPECCDDDDCPNGVCLNGACVDCVVDDDCNVNGGCSSCVSNECVAPECCTDNDCEIGQHCFDGVCQGECMINDHCPNGGSDALCDVPIYNDCQYCNTDSHLCEQGCDADSNCPSDYPVCNDDHTCGCSDTSDCAGNGEVCNIDAYGNCAYCDTTNAQCKPGCDTDSNCPADFPVCQDDHTCGCSDASDCLGNGEVCNIETYDNCAYCDSTNAQCKPGCATDSNCPSDFPVCQADHTCSCTLDSDCTLSNLVCDIENDPYTMCEYCNVDDSQCEPGCIADWNCPPTYGCGDDHLCVQCDAHRPCVDDGDVCASDYSNCFYCDINSKTCEPGCEDNAECIGFGNNFICLPSHVCSPVGISGVINITVSTYTCDGCPSSGSFETVEGGLQVTLEGRGGISCSTKGLDNLDQRDYENGVVAFFDADKLDDTNGVDDDGMGQCRGADLNLGLEGGTATWTGTGTWTGSQDVRTICVDFFGDFKPTCCCGLEYGSLAQGESTNLKCSDNNCYIP